MSGKKCALAYSGGLDTTVIVLWLKERGYEVHAVLVDVGQQEDMPALREKALRLGARTAIIRDAKPEMLEQVAKPVIGLAATYEGQYRLGTAMARPFIALEQVRLAKALGGATLVHGATGKGNDQIRFEFAYRSLAPNCEVLAPWKVWDLGGRRDLIAYLRERGLGDEYDVRKDYSMDENLWHLSVEGMALEDPRADLDVPTVLDAVKNRFAGGDVGHIGASELKIGFHRGVPISLDGAAIELGDLIEQLNRDYRAADWAWDLIIENRFTGIKSRGLYLNPAAKLLQAAADSLARTCLNKASYDAYSRLGQEYATMIYRGEFFSDQRVMLDAAAETLMRRMTGVVTLKLKPTPYVAGIAAPQAVFRKEISTFERSDFSHQDAAGFIRLSWLSSVGRDFSEEVDGALEAGDGVASDVRGDQPLPGRRLVSSTV